MVWISIALAVINLITKLPEIADALKDILDVLRSKGPLRASREAPKFLDALEAKLKECEAGGIAVKDCPLASYAGDLRERWGVIA